MFYGRRQSLLGIDSLKLIFGKHHFDPYVLDQNEIEIDVVKIVKHPGFRRYNYGPSFTMSYDFALVKLATRLDLQGEHAFLNAIALPDKTVDLDYSECVAIGWGNTDPGKRLHELVLQQVKVTILDHEDCEFSYRHHGGFSDEKLCSDNRAGKNACNGDSGGPIQCRMDVGGIKQWVLVATVLGGYKCGPSLYPAIGSNVSSVMDWINETITKR